MTNTFDISYQRYLKAQKETSNVKCKEISVDFGDYTDTQKIVVLVNVMKNNDIELFECYLRLHNDIISIRDEKDSTLLHHAAMNNYHFFVYILTKQDGIELDDYNYYDQTPLMLACTYGHKEVIKILLRYEYNLELIDCIDIARMSEQEDIMEMLVTEQEERQAMSMFRKVRRAQDDMKRSKYIQEFDGCSNDDTYDKKLSFMTKLIEKNEMEIFKMILEMRNDIISGRDEDGWSILHIAVMRNHCTAVSILLNEDGIDIDAVDYNKMTPLMSACRSVRFKEVVTLLLNQGCNVLLKDNNGWNALDIAKRAKQRDILNILIEFLEQKGLTDNGKLAGEYL